MLGTGPIPEVVKDLYLVQTIQINGSPTERQTILGELAVQPVQRHQKISNRKERGFDRFDVVINLVDQSGREQTRKLVSWLEEGRLVVTNDGSLRHKTQHEYFNSLRVNYMGAEVIVGAVRHALAAICEDEGEQQEQASVIEGNYWTAVCYPFSLEKPNHRSSLMQILDSLA